MRLAITALHQVSTGSLDPTWIDRRDHARIQPRRFHETASNDPPGRFRRQRCPGSDHETQAARAVVFALLVELADRAEKACQNCLVQIGIARWHLIRPQFQLGQTLPELRMQVLPLAHAHE